MDVHSLSKSRIKIGEQNDLELSELIEEGNDDEVSRFSVTSNMVLKKSNT